MVYFPPMWLRYKELWGKPVCLQASVLAKAGDATNTGGHARLLRTRPRSTDTPKVLPTPAHAVETRDHARSGTFPQSSLKAA